jgi:membrane protease YdiL (CAAX protease family)
MSGLPLLLSYLLVAYIVLVEPIWGARTYRKLKRDVSDGSKDSPAARIRFYRLGIIAEWLWVAVIALIVILGGATLDELGLGLQAPSEEALAFILAVGLGASVPLILLWIRSRRSEESVAEASERMLAPVSALLPYGRKERWLFASLSITAGICEEILFRGFLMFYLQEVFGSALWVAVAVSSVIFGVVHIYQGITQVLATGAFGAAMAVLYLFSGSLLLPIIVHALLDLRILLLHRPEADHTVSARKG